MTIIGLIIVVIAFFIWSGASYLSRYAEREGFIGWGAKANRGWDEGAPTPRIRGKDGV